MVTSRRILHSRSLMRFAMKTDTPFSRVTLWKRNEMKRQTLKRWAVRLLVALGCLTGFFFFVFLPVAGSFLITNSRFHYRERGPTDPAALGLPVTDVDFTSSDGIPLKGWWNPGDAS